MYTRRNLRRKKETIYSDRWHTEFIRYPLPQNLPYSSSVVGPLIAPACPPEIPALQQRPPVLGLWPSRLDLRTVEANGEGSPQTKKKWVQGTFQGTSLNGLNEPQTDRHEPLKNIKRASILLYFQKARAGTTLHTNTYRSRLHQGISQAL